MSYNLFRAPSSVVAPFPSSIRTFHSRVAPPAQSLASQYLENDDYSWTVTVHTIPKPTISAAAVPDTRDAESVHYLYVCKKGGTAEEGA